MKTKEGHNISILGAVPYQGEPPSWGTAATDAGAVRLYTSGHKELPPFSLLHGLNPFQLVTSLRLIFNLSFCCSDCFYYLLLSHWFSWFWDYCFSTDPLDPRVSSTYHSYLFRQKTFR